MIIFKLAKAMYGNAILILSGDASYNLIRRNLFSQGVCGILKARKDRSKKYGTDTFKKQ